MTSGLFSRQERQRRDRDERRKKGLCISCGKNKMGDSLVTCKVCADKASERAMIKRKLSKEAKNKKDSYEVYLERVGKSR